MQILKKTIMGVLSALLLTTAACSNKTGDKADEANANITRLNEIHSELNALGVSIAYSASVRESASEQDLTKAEALLVEFISKGERVLQIANSDDVIWFEQNKLSGQLSNARSALEKVRKLKQQRVLSPAPVTQKPTVPVKEEPRAVSNQERMGQIDERLKEIGADLNKNTARIVTEFGIRDGSQAEVNLLNQSQLKELFTLLTSNVKILTESSALYEEALKIFRTLNSTTPGYDIVVKDLQARIKAVQTALIVNLKVSDLVKAKLDASSVEVPMSEDKEFNLLIKREAI